MSVQASSINHILQLVFVKFVTSSRFKHVMKIKSEIICIENTTKASSYNSIE